MNKSFSDITLLYFIAFKTKSKSLSSFSLSTIFHPSFRSIALIEINWSSSGIELSSKLNLRASSIAFLA